MEAEETEGAPGERGTGERAAGQAVEDVSLMGSMDFTKVVACLKVRNAEINHFPRQTEGCLYLWGSGDKSLQSSLTGGSNEHKWA